MRKLALRGCLDRHGYDVHRLPQGASKWLRRVAEEVALTDPEGPSHP